MGLALQKGREYIVGVETRETLTLERLCVLQSWNPAMSYIAVLSLVGPSSPGMVTTKSAPLGVDA
jgi:hypothetical protein